VDGGDIAALITAAAGLSGALFGLASWRRTRGLDEKKADKELTDGFIGLVGRLEAEQKKCDERERELRRRVERLEGKQ
jgi:hypothetical protein